MNGPLLVKMLVNTNVRKLQNLDTLIENWDRLFFMRKDDEKLSASTLYYNFMCMLMFDKMRLRIANNYIYFQTNDVVKMSMTQFSETENFLFLEKWFLLFRTQTLVDAERNLYDYTDCLVDNVLDQCFPRFHICARFMCLSLKQAAANKDTLMATWHAFNEVAIRLLIDGIRPSAPLYGRILLSLLHDRNMSIHTSWDQQVEVYPGANIDKL